MPRPRLRLAFLFLWLGGVVLPFVVGLLWLRAQVARPGPQADFYFLAYGFAYVFWCLFLMTLVYRGPLREIRRLAREAEILVVAHAGDLAAGDEAPGHSLAALACHLERLGAAFRKRALELERLVREATLRLKLEKDTLALVLQHIAEAVLVVSRDLRLVLVNPAAARLFGPERAFLGGSALSLFEAETIADLFRRLEVRPPGESLEVSVDGHRGLASLLRDDQGRVMGLVLSFRAAGEQTGASGGVREDLSSLTLVERPAGWRPVAFDPDLFDAVHPEAELLKRPLRDLAYTAFDTETTGLEPSRGDRVVAIGAVRLERGRVLREAIFHTLVNPERPIPPEATRIHGITDEMVRDKPTLREVLPGFVRFCQGTVLLAHNAAFDLRFLELEAERLGLRLDFPVVDTLFISYGLFEEFEDHNLDRIAERLGVPVVGLHSALGDALLTAEVYLRLLPHLERRGVRTLEELFAFCRRMYSLKRLQRRF